VNDVLVIGAGPGGATAAALLARAGADVAVLDKERFPRFHIGESLLPCDLPIFARLGMDMVGQGFLRKGGAEFHDERTGERTCFLFSQGLPGTPDHAFQVERARFDAHVLDAAARAGARVELGVRVAGMEADDTGVTVHTSSGGRRARYVIDATGQDALSGHAGRSIRGI
jgi:flavin-dependent dehydrogenase